MSNTSTRKVGTVVRWFNDSGYGFIRPKNGGDDVFCHKSRNGVGDLREGETVEFVIVERKHHRNEAANVKII